jgi:hypothetical protein
MRDTVKLAILALAAILIAFIVMNGLVTIHKHTACELNGGWYTASTDSCGTLEENE